jgi:hypothetical protein
MRFIARPIYYRAYATSIHKALRDPDVFVVSRAGPPTKQHLTLKNGRTGEVMTFDSVDVGRELLKEEEEVKFTQPLEVTQNDTTYKLVDNIRHGNGSYTLVFENQVGQQQIYEHVWDY